MVNYYNLEWLNTNNEINYKKLNIKLLKINDKEMCCSFPDVYELISFDLENSAELKITENPSPFELRV